MRAAFQVFCFCLMLGAGMGSCLIGPLTALIHLANGGTAREAAWVSLWASASVCVLAAFCGTCLAVVVALEPAEKARHGVARMWRYSWWLLGALRDEPRSLAGRVWNLVTMAGSGGLLALAMWFHLARSGMSYSFIPTAIAGALFGLGLGIAGLLAGICFGAREVPASAAPPDPSSRGGSDPTGGAG